jgi:hypothetical protein
MKQKLYVAVLSAALSFIVTATAQAQHEHHGGQKPAPQEKKQEGHQHQAASGEMSKLMQEPHQLLAMAHHESMAAFAKTLSQHTEGTGTLNGDFARDAVAEIRRNFDQMLRHHQEHMQALSAAARAQMDAMMKQMEPHHAKLKEQLEALERETGGDRLDRQRVAGHTAELVKHLHEMSGMHGGHAGHSK